jgi:uncharacterized protein
MSAGARGRRWGAARSLVTALLLVAVSACASAGGFPVRPPGYQLGPASPLRNAALPEGDAWLRHYLMAGQYDSAVALLGSRQKPRDEVQRLLQLGAVQHYAGRYAASNAALARAERLVEARYARSVRQTVGRFAVNDRMADYRPASVELGMIPYFRLKNYLAIGDLESALVEARKASLLQSSMQDASTTRCGDPFLHFVSGLVFEAGGEINDALVSFRLADRGYSACERPVGLAEPALLGYDLYRTAQRLGIEDVADSALARFALVPSLDHADNGEIVVLLEQGFAAHRVQRSLHVPVYATEIDSLQSGDLAGILAAAAAVTARLAGNLLEQHVWGGSWDDHPAKQLSDALDGAHIVRVAWPEYRPDATRPAAARVFVGEHALDAPVVEDVSAQLVRALSRERSELLTRAVARAMVKYLAARELEKRAKKEGGAAAEFVVGLIANAAANALEQADTRAWSLLPDRISIARLSLPPGSYPLRLELVTVAGAEPEIVELGEVVVRRGERVFLSRRVWGEERGSDPAPRWQMPPSGLATDLVTPAAHP